MDATTSVEQEVISIDTMARKIFITYADEKFALSEKQVLKEARALGIFDKCIGYTPKDLPANVKASPLMAYARGGGYWCWKPYVIWKTLQDYPAAIVVYADAGCVLQKGKEWDEWFKMMDSCDTLLQHYREDVNYGWEELYPGVTVSASLNRWTKKSVMDYFDERIGNTKWHEQPSLWAGFVIAKGASRVVKEWYEVMMNQPELFADPEGTEKQSTDYIAHRHDQSVLSSIAYMGVEKGWSVKIIPEVSESRADAAVVTARRVIKPVPFKTKLVNGLKAILGEKLYKKIHS